MNDEVETLLRRELDLVATRVTPRPDWSVQLLVGLDALRPPRWRRPALTAVGVAALLSVLLVLLGDRAPNRPQPAPAPHDGSTKVDIGGRSLSLTCHGDAGTGRPTVVLETGLGGSAASYDRVRDTLSTDLRVCTYDRAGTGDSDAAATFPRTARSLANDLSHLVEAGGLGPEIVLVTDGFTGLSGALLAHDHPGLVAGLVFLDPRGPHVSQAQRQALGTRTHDEAPLVSKLRRSYANDALSLNGEHVSWPASEAEVAAVIDGSDPAFGEIPTIVLTPERGELLLPPLPRPVRDTWWAAVRADQRQLAAESTLGRLGIVPGVEGSLASSAPAAVAAAVREVLRTHET